MAHRLRQLQIDLRVDPCEGVIKGGVYPGKTAVGKTLRASQGEVARFGTWICTCDSRRDARAHVHAFGAKERGGVGPVVYYEHWGCTTV
jgi:hypothetical protein